MKHRELVNNTQTESHTVVWLIESNYLHSTRNCTKCSERPMNLNITEKNARFKCSRCSNTESVFKDTIFYNIKKNIIEIMDLIYFWSLDLSQKKVGYQSNTLSHDTLFVWFEKLSKLAARIIRSENQNGKIGGRNHRVQIDESKFSKRKYNVGREVRSPWIVGGIDLETREVFFVETFFRDAETLNNIIINHVEPGSIIFTDCWRGYNSLQNQNFEHFTVNHSRNFIDPETGANTQLIENTWGVFKKRFRARGINSNCKIELYFLEFMFKMKYGNHSFEKLLENLYCI